MEDSLTKPEPKPKDMICECKNPKIMESPDGHKWCLRCGNYTKPKDRIEDDRITLKLPTFTMKNNNVIIGIVFSIPELVEQLTENQKVELIRHINKES